MPIDYEYRIVDRFATASCRGVVTRDDLAAMVHKLESLKRFRHDVGLTLDLRSALRFEMGFEDATRLLKQSMRSHPASTGRLALVCGPPLSNALRMALRMIPSDRMTACVVDDAQAALEFATSADPSASAVGAAR